jgi:hypothetical protein
LSMPEALFPSVVIRIHSRHVTNYSVVVVWITALVFLAKESP